MVEPGGPRIERASHGATKSADFKVATKPSRPFVGKKQLVPLALMSVTLAACEASTGIPASGEQMSIQAVTMESIAATPYANLGEGIQDFGSQYHERTGLTLVFGPSVVMGVEGGTPFLVTPLLGEGNQPLDYAIATYEDPQGKIQHDTLIAVSGTATSEGGAQSEFLAFKPLDRDLSAKLLNGEQVEINLDEDLGKPFYGLTLKQGVTMASFQEQVSGVGNDAQAARNVLRNNLATFFITDPNTGESSIAMINNNDALLDRVVGILTGARPAHAASEPEVTLTPPVATETPTTNPTEVPQNLTALLPPEVFKQLQAQTENQAAKFFTVEGDKLFVTIGGQRVEVDPATSGIDIGRNGEVINNQNALYGDIVTIKGVDGKFYAFAPDYSEGWFEVIEASSNVEAPTQVTLEQVQDGRVLTSLLLDPEVNVPFDGDTVYDGTSMNHDEGDNAVYIRNRSAQEPGTKPDQTPTEWVKRYFKVTVNGADFYFNPIKWLDTSVYSSENRDLAEFKLFFATFGAESKGENAFDYQKYLDSYDVATDGRKLVIYPLISADDSYLQNLRLEQFPLANTQPSLIELLRLNGNKPADMPFFKDIISVAPSGTWQWDFQEGRLPPEIQNMLFPITYTLTS